MLGGTLTHAGCRLGHLARHRQSEGASCSRGARQGLVPRRPAHNKRQSLRVGSSSGSSEREAHPIEIQVGGQTATQPGAWLTLLQTLNEAGVELVAPQQVKFLREQGLAVVDIRPAHEYAEGFVGGAVNVQLFRLIEGWSGMATMRKVGFFLFGISKGTEPNPDFIDEVEAMVESKEQGVVLVCNLGGVLELPSAEKPGLKQQSRSLIAAYQIHRAGFKNIKVLAGGMSRWLEEERDVWVPGEAVSDSGSEQDAADDAVPGV